MTRLALGLVIGLGLGIVVAAAAGIHAAGTEPDEDTVQLAQEAGVSPGDVLGALNSLEAAGISTSARAYLIGEGLLAGPVTQPAAPARPSPGWPARVRLTEYVEYGVTYSGGHPYPGSTACSWNFPLGTRFRLPDGEVFTCNDRGLLGSSGWLDLWRRADLTRAYGPYVTVEVLP